MSESVLPETYSQNKSQLRRAFLKARQSLPTEIWQEKSLRLCEHLKNSPEFAQARTILSYFSFRQEPDLSSLFMVHRSWGFPRCVGNSLSWHFWHPRYSGNGTLPLQLGTYGIQEPHPLAPPIKPEMVDLILVPAVACDVRGYRLGYGGGYYDRLLTASPWSGKRTIGIVFEFARLPQLPNDGWDRRLDGICTERGLYWCQPD